MTPQAEASLRRRTARRLADAAEAMGARYLLHRDNAVKRRVAAEKPKTYWFGDESL